MKLDLLIEEADTKVLAKQLVALLTEKLDTFSLLDELSDAVAESGEDRVFLQPSMNMIEIIIAELEKRYEEDDARLEKIRNSITKAEDEFTVITENGYKQIIRNGFVGGIDFVTENDSINDAGRLLSVDLASSQQLEKLMDDYKYYADKYENDYMETGEVDKMEDNYEKIANTVYKILRVR